MANKVVIVSVGVILFAVILVLFFSFIFPHMETISPAKADKIMYAQPQLLPRQRYKWLVATNQMPYLSAAEMQKMLY